MQLTERIVEQSRNWLGLLVQLFLLAGAAVSCYFVGLFLYLGLDLMVLLDKQSLIEAIFFYAAIFSVVMAIATIVTAPLPQPKAAMPEPPPPAVMPMLESARKRGLMDRVPLFGSILRGADTVREAAPEIRASAEDMVRRWKQDAKARLRAAVPALVFASLLFVGWLLHAWRGALFLLVMIGLLLVARAFPRFLYSISLLIFVLLGWLRADLLSYATPSMQIRGTMQPETIEAVVVLASGRGILALTAVAKEPRHRARFLPWERVASIEPSPNAPASFSRAGLCDWLRAPPWLSTFGVGNLAACALAR
ncbi:MAG: hypothetical protein ACKVP7_09270 [Hyphomicrobiaceae bacterium]